MPLAFSTLGCPEDSLDQVIETAHASGSTGLELRCAEGQIVFPGMSADAVSQIASQIKAAGLEIVTLASYVRVAAPEPSGAQGEVAAELEGAVVLASVLGAPYIRVFPGAGLPPALDGIITDEMAAADQRAAHRLNAAAAKASELGVTILLETHDSHPRGEDINRILAHVDPAANVSVIWDLMHPWRHDEDPARTAELLAPHLAYAQYKDGIRLESGNNVSLTLPGQGQLPLREMQKLVADISRQHGIADPWISLEWERAWHPELPPLDQALASLKSALQ